MAIKNNNSLTQTVPKAFNGNIIVLVTVLVMLVSFGIQSAFGIFFKPMSNDFGWTKALTSGAFSLSFFMSGLLGIAVGAFCDRYGSRGVITFCGAMLGSGYLLMSQINVVWQFYLYYGIVIGVGMSGIWVPIMSTIARRFGERKNIITAIAMAGGGAGSLFGPPFADWLISQFEWRKSFIILGCLVLIVVISGAQFLRNVPACIGQQIHNDQAEARPKVEGLTLKEAIRTRQIWILFAMLFCLGFCAYVIIVHIAPYAIELGISTANAANVLATVGASTIVGRIVLASFATRLGNRMIYIIGFIIIAVTSFWFILAQALWMLFLIAAIFGFGWGAGASQSPLVAELFGLKSHGLILGFSVLAYSLGSAIGPFLAGYLFDISGNYQLSFIVCTLIACIGLISTALLKSHFR